MEKRSQVEMLSKRIFWAPNVRGNGGIRTHNENFCHELINYAVRIVYYLHSLHELHAINRPSPFTS